jgi:phosphate transport system substrate-binding protein
MFKQVRSVYIAAVLVVLAFAAYMFWPREPLFPPGYLPPILGVNAGNYPTVNGSVSAVVLGDMLLARALRVPGELRRALNPPGGLQVTFPPNKDIETVQMYQAAHQRVRHEGTHAAYLRLINGPADRAAPAGMPPTSLILVTREPDESELAVAKDRNVDLSVCLVAYDALVFVVNEKNPVKNLPLAKARGIFKGEITDWAEVGGPAGKIATLLPTSGDTRELINRDLLEPFSPVAISSKPFVPAATVVPVSGPASVNLSINSHQGVIVGYCDGHAKYFPGQGLSPAACIAKVAKDPNAIACVSWHEATVVAPSAAIRLLNVNGITPDGRNLRKVEDFDKDKNVYPLIEPIYGVVRSDTKQDDPAYVLLKWLRNHHGQRMVAECGYVPL